MNWSAERFDWNGCWALECRNECGDVLFALHLTGEHAAGLQEHSF
jgi:hypothetical protein